MSSIYRALDDETRRLLLDELTAKDAQTLFELCGALAMKHGTTMTRQAVSQHLAVLEDAGLVHSVRRGRTKVHHVDPSPLAAIARRWPIPQEDAR